MRFFHLLAAIVIIGYLYVPNLQATEITGTTLDLKCVHDNKDYLSLNGLVVPVKVFVKGCIEQFTNPEASDTTHGGVDEPKIDGATGVPAIEKWTILSLEEIDRIPCKVNEWSKSNPNTTDSTEIKIDLSTECVKQP